MGGGGRHLHPPGSLSHRVLIPTRLPEGVRFS